MTIKPILGGVSAIIAAVSLAACAQTSSLQQGVYSAEKNALDLGTVAFHGGKTMDFNVGIGSGAFHYKGDADNVFYTVTDRGPNIKCGDVKKLLGTANEGLCGSDKKGKVFPIPGFAPTIYKIALNDDHSFKVLETVTLKNTVGQPISGVVNPLKTSNTENGYGNMGDQLSFDSEGLDVEAVVKMSDGTFWISEEYGPSIAHVAADGRVLNRLVPTGLEKDLVGAKYPVTASLPGILKWRKLNRGIESIAVSDDEKSLYFAMQSPLAYPDAKAYKTSNAVRLFKLDIASLAVVGEYIYPLDDPKSFVVDSAKKARKFKDIKISEMTALKGDRLLVLERISKTTKFYVVDLGKGRNIAGSKWDAEVVSPSLEQLKVEGMAKKGIPALAKTLVMNTDNRGGMPKKIEGIGLVDANTLMLINDNDFGIDGNGTAVVVVKLSTPLF